MGENKLLALLEEGNYVSFAYEVAVLYGSGDFTKIFEGIEEVYAALKNPE